MEKMRNDLNNPTNTLNIKYSSEFPDEILLAGVPEYTILSTFTSTQGETFGTFSFNKKKIKYLALEPGNLADSVYYNNKWKDIYDFPMCSSVMGVDFLMVDQTDIDNFVSAPYGSFVPPRSNLGEARCMKMPIKNGTYTFKLKQDELDYPANIDCRWIANQYTCRYSSGSNIQKEKRVGQIKIIKSKNKTIVKCEKCINGNFTLRY